MTEPTRDTPRDPIRDNPRDNPRQGRIRDINGPIVTIVLPGIRNGEPVRIGELGLFGEVISLRGEVAIVQTYESSEGVRPGEPGVGVLD